MANTTIHLYVWVLMLLLEIRGRRALSQEQLALEADLHRTYVSDIERGARNPTVTVVKVLADALKSKPSELFDLAERNWTTMWPG